MPRDGRSFWVAAIAAAVLGSGLAVLRSVERPEQVQVLGLRERRVAGEASTGPGRAAQARPLEGTRHTEAFRPGELIVRYRSGVGRDVRRSVRAGEDLALVRRLSIGNAELVRVRERSVDAALTSVRRRAQVEFAEPNFQYGISTVPNDPLFDQLWGLRNTGQTVGRTAGAAGADISAVDAWKVTQGSADVAVAVVDTGVATDHPDLAANIWSNPRETRNGVDDDANGYIDDVSGWDWVGDDPSPADMHGHGTHVAGTIAARGNDGQGVTGVSWRAGILPLRVLDANGSGTSADIAEAFAYAGRMRTPIVNASFGGAGSSRLVLDAITAATDTLFVVAAGNATSDNDATATYPCNYIAANVICVAATDQSDQLATFSNYGSTTVHIGAPGVNILSTVNQLGAPIFTDDFETDIATRWVAGGEGTAWARTSNVARSPSHSVTDSPSVAYADASDTWLRLAEPLDLSATSGCRVTFALWAKTQATRDVVSVEAAKSAAGPWTPLYATSGSTGGRFVLQRAELAGFAGEQNVLLRFRLVTDASVTDDGVAIDDVSVQCLETPSADRLASLNGTSMATPHVAGAAALVRAVAPTATPNSLKTLLMTSADALPALDGKVVTGARLNVARAIDQVAPPKVRVGGGVLGTTFHLSDTFPVSWEPLDERDITSYDVRYQRAGAASSLGTSTAWMTNTTERQAVFDGAMGFTYCFSARAVSPEGPWSTDQACTTIPLNDPSLSRSSGWTSQTSTAYYGGDASVTTQRGARLSRSVSALHLAVVATRCSGCGTIDVYLDSTRLRRISLDAPTTERRRLLQIASFPSLRSGTLSIRVVSSGRPVRIEGLGVGKV